MVPEISIVVPVFNERNSIATLVREIVAALERHVFFEIIYVDDHSTDDTLSKLLTMRSMVSQLRVITHGQRCGQSTAIRSGVLAARAPWVATLDGDGQNDPVDIIKLLGRRVAAHQNVKLFAGWRVARQDSSSKRWASRFANTIRSWLLHDGAPDTGCGIKLFERAAFLTLPYFDHMHRFLPAMFQRAGWDVESVPVSHRQRYSGVSKYDNLRRAWVGVPDLLGVAWLIRRSKRPSVQEL